MPSAERARGLALLERPVFLCGVHRSGTTLLRNLLDDDPSLLVLPSEGGYYTGLGRQLAGLTDAEALGLVGPEWLRRLANPINQPPYWVLGRSRDDGSPYVEFVRWLLAWWPVVREVLAPRARSWPIAAVALAYGSCRGGGRLAPEWRAWAEKTPTHEQHRRRLRADYPRARFVQVVRAPVEVYASRRALELATFGAFAARPALKDLARSYRIAAAERTHPDYRVVRYEELLRARAETMRGVAEFVGVDATPALLAPTVAGIEAPSNSSFDRPRAAAALDADELRRLADVVGPSARAVGYALPADEGWRSRARRFGYGF